MKTSSEISEFERDLEAEPRGLIGAPYAVARTLGISRSVITRLLDNGMPGLPGGKVSAAIVLQWLVVEAEARGSKRSEGEATDDGHLRTLDPTDPRSRVVVANAERIERQNRIDAGEYVAIPDVLDIVGAEFRVVRAGLYAISGRVESELASLSGVAPEAVRRILLKEIGAALDALGKDATLSPLKNGVEHENEIESEIESGNSENWLR
jgi:hypothetical protein